MRTEGTNATFSSRTRDETSTNWLVKNSGPDEWHSVNKGTVNTPTLLRVSLYSKDVHDTVSDPDLSRFVYPTDDGVPILWHRDTRFLSQGWKFRTPLLYWSFTGVPLLFVPRGKFSTLSKDFQIDLHRLKSIDRVPRLPLIHISLTINGGIVDQGSCKYNDI